MLRHYLAVALLLLATPAYPAVSAPNGAEPNTDAAAREAAAEALFQARDWSGAAAAFERLAKEQPTKPRFAARLAAAQFALHRYGEAAASYERAVALGAPAANLGLAWPRAWARSGDVAKTVSALVKLAGAGFGGGGGLQQASADPDLAAARQDARWGDIFRAMDRTARPCLYAPEFRQFDFWVGEWDVVPNGQPETTAGASSSIASILDGCVILENWQGNAYAGKSFNFYDAATKKWRQFWVDSQGAYLQFEGEGRDGNLYYTGTSPASGQTPMTQHKLTFLRQGNDEVRQLWEQSTDAGKTWTVAFDGIYRRKTRTRSGA